MATRIYLSRNTDTTPISPTPSASWTDTSISPAHNLARTSKLGIATANLNYNQGGTTVSNRDILFRKHVCQLKAGQVITGGQAIKMQLLAFTGQPLGSAFVDLTIRIIASNGTTVRKTMLALTQDDVAISDASLTNRQFTATSAAVPYETQEGDCLVIETGINQTTAV